MLIDLKFDEATKTWRPEIKDNNVDMTPDKTVEMAADPLGGITKFEVAGIPLGAAAAGGALAYVVDFAFDRFLPNFTGAIANLVAAWTVMNWGSRWVGKDTAKYAAIFLAYEAVRDMIEPALGRVVGSIGGQATVAQSDRGSGVTQSNTSSTVRQAQSVAAAHLGKYVGSF